MGFFDKVKKFVDDVMSEDDEDFDGVDLEGPEITIKLDNSETAIGGFIKGSFTLRGVDERVKLLYGAVDIFQDGVYVGHRNIPYLGRILREDEIIEEEFDVQVITKGTEPTGGGVEHVLRVSIQCVNCDCDAEEEVVVLDEKAETGNHDRNHTHIIPEEIDFLDSSVRGELRIFGFESGMVISWNDQITVRNSDGSVRWRVEGPGRTVAVSPDENRIAAAWKREHRISFYDLDTGDEIGDVYLDDYIDHIVWLDDNSGIVAACGDNEIKLLDVEGNILRNITNSEIEYVGAMQQISGKEELLVADSNGSKICRISTDDGEILEETESYATDEVAISPDGAWMGFIGGNSFEVFNSSDMEQLVESEMPGKLGVKYEAQTEDWERSWESKFRISPDSTRYLINVKDGQVWHFDFVTREYFPFPRRVMDFVEDTFWIDDRTVAAIDSLGNFCIVDLEDMELQLKEKDYMA